MLFGKKKKKKSKPVKKEIAPIIELSVPYSEHFKGYKRIKLTTYKDEEALRGSRSFRATGKATRIRFAAYEFPDENTLIRVYADGVKIGTIWKYYVPEIYDLIVNAKCEKASVLVTDDTDDSETYLYLKFRNS